MSYSIETFTNADGEIRGMNLLQGSWGQYCPWNSSGSPCGTWCPFFEISEVAGMMRVTLDCAPRSKHIVIEEE